MKKTTWIILFALILAVATACSGIEELPEEELPGEELDRLEGAVFVLFICIEGHNQPELQRSYNAILRDTDSDVIIATLPGGPTMVTINTDDGAKDLPVRQLLDINPEDIDGFVIIGGDVTMHLDDQLLLGYVQLLDELKVPLAGVCGGTTIIAKAGLLWGKEATSEPKYRALMEEYGVVWISGSVHVDERYVTARFGSEPRMIQEVVKLIANNSNGS